MTRTFQILGSNGFEGAKLQINPLKQFVMVSGLDYHDFWSFNSYAEKHKAKLLKTKNAKEDFIFYMVDILVGKIRKIEIIGSKSAVETTTKFDIVDKSNYVNHYFESNGKKIISKTDIYKLIEQIGIDNPNTLVEVNVFSHAYSGGPILVNSVAGIDDKDLRMADIKNKIFDFSNFKKAFVTGGIFKIWGCQSHPPYNYLIKRVMQNPKYKKDGTTKDTDEFIVNDIAVPNHEILSKYIDTKYYTSLPNGKIKLTFLQIKKIFSDGYCANYAAWLAYYVDITVQYSLPATYASFGNPEVFRISDDTKMNVSFFEKYLGLTLGELNYGIYDKASVTKLLTP